MKTILFIVLAIALVSCVETRNRRATIDSKSINPISESTRNDIPPAISTPPSSGDELLIDGGTLKVPEEIAHCSWSSDGERNFKTTTTHLGEYNICQGKNNELDIYVQLKTPPPNIQTCMIPVYDTDNKVIYIGEPRCFHATDPKTVYKVTVLKNRSGYSSFDITGVLIMLDVPYYFSSPYPQQPIMLPDAYIHCANWLDRYGDSSYCQVFDEAQQFVYHKFQD
ncbi:MAG: hypothetical protein KAQ98_04585 [Bacteriovoracaceae bacterium]|nr:hypothetical protein [Bacteriovoracaceae bacterium]